MSMTHAGPTNRRGSIVSHVLLGRSLPVIQCTGASKCVPVCSPMWSVFQYQAGPLSSYFEITSIVTPGDGANIGGRPMTGVAGPRGCVRSTTTTRPDCRSSTSCASDILQIPLKLKAILQQRQIGDVPRRPHGLDFRDDRRQFARRG